MEKWQLSHLHSTIFKLIIAGIVIDVATNKTFTFYFIYIKTSENDDVSLLLKDFTFYSIYIKTK